MPCYHPMVVYRSKAGRQSNGAWPIVFNKRDGYADMKTTIPCGHCIGCKLERSRQWAIRCMCEASQYDLNTFITLTYDKKNVPNCQGKNTLYKRDIQLFMKRLRKKYGSNVRYLQCGEYGKKWNPHHHMLLFNHDFIDKKEFFKSNGIQIYRSEELERLWKYGFSTVGDLTFESAAYVARYATKKITGDRAEDHYRGREPEYITMSRRPGIAKTWFDKYKSDVYNEDKMVVRDKFISRPPRYFDKLFENFDKIEMEHIKYKREKKAELNKKTSDQLIISEKIKINQTKTLNRELEDDIERLFN